MRMLYSAVHRDLVSSFFKKRWPIRVVSTQLAGWLSDKLSERIGDARKRKIKGLRPRELPIGVRDGKPAAVAKCPPK